MKQTAPAIESTFKARDVEGIADLHFYRAIGFQLAQFFAKLKMTPANVSLLGGLVGVIAGHLYYYCDLRVNIVGMLLHVGANAFDNADGQLARLTNTRSLEGRVIDSVADYFVFASVYVHLALRSLVAGATPFVCLLAVAAAISHALQGAGADYYRNAYLYFVNGRSRADWDSWADLRSNYGSLSWRHQPWRKFLLELYLNFTRQQEAIAPRLKSLRDIVARSFAHEIPSRIKICYQISARPMLKWWRLLMTNTRMLILFILLFVGRPIFYFWIELTVLNLLLVYLIVHQENMAQTLMETAAEREIA
jgi:hypothetical protein